MSYVDRYEQQMRHATDLYADVLHALWAAELPATMTQTGGMCLAIELPTVNGWIWLTDREDVLSWERDEAHGWACGLYDNATDNAVPVWIEYAERQTPEEAVRLALAALNSTREMR